MKIPKKKPNQKFPKRKKTLIDTNVFFRWLQRDVATVNELERIGFSNILISVISEIEVRSSIKPESKAKVENLLKESVVVPLTPEVIFNAALVISRMNDEKIQNGFQDRVIAATAIAIDAEVFTYNLKDFIPIPKIKIYKTKTFKQDLSIKKFSSK